MHKKNNANVSRSLGALFALFCLAGVCGNARAAFIVYICDDALCSGGGDVIVVDQGVGDNFPGSAIVGQINAGGLNIGGFTIATNVAQSSPLIGSSSQPQLNLSFSAVTSDNGTHTLYMYASNTGFIAGNTFLLTLGGTQPPLGTGSSVTAGAWGGNSNGNLDLSNPLASFTNFSSPFANSVGGSFSPSTNPFGLTIGVAITRHGPGTTTGELNFNVTNTVSAAPETGSSMLLLGISLLSLAGWRRARRA